MPTPQDIHILAWLMIPFVTASEVITVRQLIKTVTLARALMVASCFFVLVAEVALILIFGGYTGIKVSTWIFLGGTSMHLARWITRIYVCLCMIKLSPSPAMGTAFNNLIFVSIGFLIMVLSNFIFYTWEWYETHSTDAPVLKKNPMAIVGIVLSSTLFDITSVYLHIKSLMKFGATGALGSNCMFSVSAPWAAELSSMDKKPKSNPISLLHYVMSISPQYQKNCTHWAVMTTIFDVSQSVQNTARRLKGWCMVVVGDSSGPSSYDLGLADNEDETSNLFYLNTDLQKKLAEVSEFVGSLPWKHFGRKNVGYLWAILHNAMVVWDFDDDNELIVDHSVLLSSREPGGATYEVLRKDTDPSVAINPYPIMGATNQAAWPRGFSLTFVKDASTQPTMLNQTVKIADAPGRIGVIQSLANHDPDVDAIYRLTQPMPLNFFTPKIDDLQYFLIPKGKLTPYNAQATLHFEGALWGMLLPVTVQGRVSDIWRGYAMQRLMWDIDLQLGFAGPYVIQNRNAHNYLGDLNAESDLYFKTDKLIEFLANEWSSDSPQLVHRVEELYVSLYERGYIELADTRLLQLWLQELAAYGYKFPSVRPGKQNLLHKNIISSSKLANSTSASNINSTLSTTLINTP